VPPPIWILFNIAVHAARALPRTVSNAKPGFSAARLPRALATDTNEIPMRAWTDGTAPKLTNTEFGETCCPGTLITWDEVNGWSAGWGGRRTRRSPARSCG